MSKQTTVEWLKEQLEEYGSSSHLSLDWSTFDELVDQAKAMEREQIIDAWIATDNELQRMSAEQYYNETFKGGNNE